MMVSVVIALMGLVTPIFWSGFGLLFTDAMLGVAFCALMVTALVFTMLDES